MKKFFIFVIIFLLFSLNIKAIDINSKYAVVYNLNDDNIIYEKNSNEKSSVASLTKIMTTILTIEKVSNLDDTVTVTYNDLLGLNGYAVAGFKAGDKVTYNDLIYALMLPSGADAGQILANSIAGSIEEFANLMNEKANTIGMKNTHFSNPIGKDDDNYSTASDMALLLKYAIKNDKFKDVFNKSEYTTTNNIKLTKTTNSVAKKYSIDISSLTGSKTGFTNEASYCLASTSTLNNVNYLVITLGAEKLPDHINDTMYLYNYFDSNYSYKEILKNKQLLKTIKVKESKTKEYNIYSNKSIKKYLSNDIDLNKIKYEYKGVEVLNRKIKKGDYLGKVKIIYDNNTLDTYKVYLDKDIKYYNYFLLLIPLGIMILFVIIIKAKLKKKKRKKNKKKRAIR